MYRPEPQDTSHIALPEDLRALTERLARNAHDAWAKQRLEEGWTFGPERNDSTKEHPDLIPYDELPESEKTYDREAVVQTLKLIMALGYRIEKH